MEKLKNTNIFKINEDKVLKKLAKFNFIEDIYVKKIIPSSININLKILLLQILQILLGFYFFQIFD